MSSQVPLNDNYLVEFIVHALNTTHIYEGMFYLSGIAAFAPWLIVIFSAVRLMQEASDTLSMKAAMGEAITSMGKPVYFYLIYSSTGLFFFGAIFSFTQLFEQYGSTQLIHTSLLDLRSQLATSEKEATDWTMKLLEYASDTFNIFGAGVAWSAYQLLSLFYIFFNQFIEIIFAIGFVVIYVWGFIAIGTMALKDELNLMKGFTLGLFTLAIWAVLESVLLGVLWIMSKGATASLAASYAGTGFGSTAITVWYLYAIVMMFMVIVVKALTPFIAYTLAQNQSIGGALGGASAAVAAIGLNQILKSTLERGGDGFRDMMPDSEGGRFRDGMGQKVGDVMHSPLSDVGRSFREGVGNLVSGRGTGPVPVAAGDVDIANSASSAGADPGEAGPAAHSTSSLAEDAGATATADTSADSMTDGDSAPDPDSQPSINDLTTSNAGDAAPDPVSSTPDNDLATDPGETGAPADDASPGDGK